VPCGFYPPALVKKFIASEANELGWWLIEPNGGELQFVVSWLWGSEQFHLLATPRLVAVT